MSSDEEDMAWGEQAQIAADMELSPKPPQGPGGNPKVDRRSATGSNFMRCLPDQATSLTSFTCDRRTYLGGSAVVQRRGHKSKSATHLCQAERQGVGGPGGVRVDDESEGSCVENMLKGDPGRSGGSQAGGHAQTNGCVVSSSYSQSDTCGSSSCTLQTSGFFFSNRHLGHSATGSHPCSVNSWLQTGADSKKTHTSQQSVLSGRSCGSCSTSCGCSHHSSSGRSCVSSCCMPRHTQHDCFGTVLHSRIFVHPRFVHQHERALALPCKASLCSSVPFSVSVPSKLVQKRLQMGVRRVPECKLHPKSFAGSYAQQRQLVPRLCIQ